MQATISTAAEAISKAAYAKLAELERIAQEKRRENQETLRRMALEGMAEDAPIRPLAELVAQTLTVGREDGYPDVKIQPDVRAQLQRAFQAELLPTNEQKKPVLGALVLYGDASGLVTKPACWDADYAAWSKYTEYAKPIRAAEVIAATEAVDEQAARWLDADPPEAGESPFYLDVTLRDVALRHHLPQFAAKAHTPLTDAAVARWKQRREAGKEAKEAAKTQYIANWIAQHGTPEEQEQFRENLLCRKATIKLIADKAFTDAGLPDKFSYEDTFCDESSCPCGRKDLDCLSRKHYAVWREIKKKLPEGSTFDFHTVREHLRDEADWEEGGSVGPPSTFVTVHIPVGPFTFDRDISLEART